jgi:hypothetical protein
MQQNSPIQRTKSWGQHGVSSFGLRVGWLMCKRFHHYWYFVSWLTFLRHDIVEIGYCMKVVKWKLYSRREKIVKGRVKYSELIEWRRKEKEERIKDEEGVNEIKTQEAVDVTRALLTHWKRTVPGRCSFRALAAKYICNWNPASKIMQVGLEIIL